MWPALLVAAAAGSSFIAKKILNQNATEPIENNTKCDKDSNFISDHEPNCKFDKPHEPEGFINSYFQQKDSSFICNLGCNIQELNEGLFNDSIFRFSSTSGSEMGPRKGCRKIKGNVKCGNVRSGEKAVFGMDQRKRFYVCLKKRRTNKVPSGKCDSCASKGNSVFGWGLGIGMMCMMTAGKSEINRLNTTMNETAKAVEELKSELSRKKVAHDLHASKHKAETNERNIRESAVHVFAESSNENKNIFRALDHQVAEEGEYASSVLTEEQQPEVMEMDQLEAELESELQKLPWCAAEGLELDGGCKNESNQADDHNPEAYQSSGVLPSELNQKLCQLLIEQQESQIVELQSELHQTHSKLHEKEAELQALKDCVRRLTEFSLGSASDEDTDGKMEGDINGGGDQEKKVGPESRKSIVGMKRSMNF